MSGRKPAKGHPSTGRNDDRGRGGRPLASDVSGNGAERDPGSRVRHHPPRSERGGSLGAAQQRWPEYNRIIISGTAIAGAVVIITGAVIEAVTR